MPTMTGLNLHRDDSNDNNSNTPYATCLALDGD